MRVVWALLPLLLAGCLDGASHVETPPAATDVVPVLPTFGVPVVVGTQGNEPVTRVGPDGTIYVAALQYVYVSTDAGASFHKVPATGATPIYASDSALTVSPAGRAYVAFDWPYAGHTAVCSSADRGATWGCSPLVVPGATDRMWILAPTADDVYLITGQTLDRPTFMVSHDQGKTWSQTYQDLRDESQGADLAFDPVTKHIVEAASGGSGWGVRAWAMDGTWLGFTSIDLRTPEPTLAVDDAGTWWATACAPGKGSCAPAAAWSKDQGKTWTIEAVPFGATTSFMHFIDARQPGRVALIWYETKASTADDPNAEWRVAASQTLDGKHWSTTVLTADPVHKGPLCRSLGCLGADRFAGDFLGLDLDARGDLYASWNRQTGDKLLPATQLNPGDWERVEFARTHA